MGTINRTRRNTSLGLLALEPRWMFDGAAVTDAAHAAPDAAAKALIPDAPAPVEVKAADPAQNSGKKEVVFVDTSVAGYQTLEAAVKPGIEIEVIDGTKSGLAQIAKWAETHTGYDSITVIGHGAEASLRLGTDTITITSLFNSTAEAELAQIGHSLKSGGELLIEASGIGQGADGRQLIADLATATGATVGAFSDLTDASGADGNWTLDAATGVIEVQRAEPTLDGGKTEVVFIDTSVTDYRTLVAAVKPGIEVNLIDGSQNGLAQMAAWATTHSGYDSISILSHGLEGQLNLGAAQVTDDSLSDTTVRSQLSRITASLKPGGGLLLYGCDIAQGTDGQKFLDDLAATTGVKVAASTHIIGKGGDWSLDAATGVIDATPFAAESYDGVLVGFGASGFTTAGTVASGATANPFSGVTVIDSSTTDSVTATITFSAASGTLSGAGLSGSNGSYSLAGGSPSTLQAQLRALTFTASATGDVTFTLSLSVALGSKSTLASVSAPRGVAIDSSGNMYACGSANGNVYKITPGGTVTTFASIASGGLYGISIDASDNLYVADYNGSKIEKVAPDGTVTILTTSVGRPGQTFVDLSGNIIVAGYGDGNIYKVSSDGSTVTTLASGYRSPAGVWVDSSGNIFFCDYGPSGTINKIPYSNGSYGAVTTIATGLSYPDGIAVDSSGNIFATLFGTNALIKVPYSNGSYESATTICTWTKHPWGLNINDNGDIVVAAYNDGHLDIVSLGKSFTNASTAYSVSVAATPVFTSGTTASFAENGSGTAYNAAATTTAGTVSYALAGADAGKFNINATTGAVTFKVAPDMETPASAANSNVYSITINATDNNGTSSKAVAITVTDVAPAWTAPAPISLNDNSANGTVVATLAGTGDTSGVTWSIQGGNASGLFAINATTGAITVADASKFNIAVTLSYTLAVRETDGTTNVDHNVTVNVNHVIAAVTSPTPSSPTPAPAAPPVVVAPQPAAPPAVEAPQPAVPQVFAPLPPITPVAAPPVADVPKTVAPPAPVVVAPPVISVVITQQFTPTTVDGGFRVPVVTATQGGPPVEGLIALRPEIMVPQVTDGPVRIALPLDAFAHTRSDAVVTLNALRINGQPLPQWLNFDSRSGTLTGQPPGDFKGTMVVKIIARDDKGQEAAITIRINGQPERTGTIETGKPVKLGQHQHDKAVGKVAFTQQLKLAARNAVIRF